MANLWMVATPTVVLFATVLLLISYKWTVGLLLAVLLSIILYVRSRHINKGYHQELSQIQIEWIKSEITKVLPVSSSNGWYLEGMSAGVRVFERYFSVLPNSDYHNVLACSTLVDCSPKRALLTTLSVPTVSSWFGRIKGPVNVVKQALQPLSKIPTSGDSDTIAFTVNTRVSTLKLALITALEATVGLFVSSISQARSSLSNEKIQRSWKLEGKRYHLVMCPSFPSSIPYEWSFLLFSAVHGHKDLTLVTMLALPSSSSNHTHTQKFIAFQLCSLRDHVLMKEILGSSSPSPRTDEAKKNQPCPVKVETVDKPLENSLKTTENSLEEALPSIEDPDNRYVDIGRKCADDLLAVADAKEGNGWISVGTSKGVYAMKKAAEKGQPPINCVKGTMTMNAPPDFILRILMDPVHNNTLDDMLKEIRHIKNVTPSIQLMHLIYKVIWPTSGRDFSVCNVVGRLDAHTRVHAACSVVDPRIPEVKGLVRADVMAGGYCIKDVPGNPNMAEVTYVTQVNLKGNVPTFVVNKIIESQPQCVNQLNTIVMREFDKLNDSPERMKEFVEKFPIYYIKQSASSSSISSNNGQSTLEPTTATSPSPSSVTDKPVVVVAEDQISFTTVATSDEHETTAGRDLEDTMTSNSMNSFNASNNTTTNTRDSGRGGRRRSQSDPLDSSSDDVFGERSVPNIPVSAVLDKLPKFKRSDEVSLSESQSSLTSSINNDSLLEYPRTNAGVDFRTLSHQIAARMLEEMFNISGLDMMDPLTYKDQRGGWKFQGIEKDVAILRKKMPDSPFDSFIGRGLIELPPQEVFNCVRNPNQRFTYDNMLKELHIVKQIEDGIYVLHLHHEANQCFLKQSRDFCLLVCERSEPNKKMIVGSSVDIPDCPPQHNVTRGKIFTSGWVIEPYRKSSKLYTQVTYTLQVDMGGVPSSLVNFIARRQPLAVAYIKEFLESTSTSFKEKSMEMNSSKESKKPSDNNDYMPPIRFKI